MVDASKAAMKLADLEGTSSVDTFIFLRNKKTRANARVEKAQAAYVQHINSHGYGKG